jgi:hypothetical protein
MIAGSRECSPPARQLSSLEKVGGTWRSLVAHLHGVQGVPSSNLGVPTIQLKQLITTAAFELRACGQFVAESKLFRFLRSVIDGLVWIALTAGH